MLSDGLPTLVWLRPTLRDLIDQRQVFVRLRIPLVLPNLVSIACRGR